MNFINKRTLGWNLFYCWPHCFETMLLLFQNQLGCIFGSSHKAHCNPSLKYFTSQNVTVSDQECSVFIYSPELFLLKRTMTQMDTVETHSHRCHWFFFIIFISISIPIIILLHYLLDNLKISFEMKSWWQFLMAA